MTVQDYGVSFGYGAQDGYYYGPNGTVGAFHRGDDYPCPDNTPLVVCGQVIGYSGHTGVVGGPHCHIQEWSGSVGNTRKPQNSFGPGTVTAVNYASQWGYHITVRGADGWNTTYCHLSQQTVAVGAELNNATPQGGDDMIRAEDRDLVERLTRRLKLWGGSFNMDLEMRAWTNQDWRRFLQEGMDESEGQFNELKSQAARTVSLESTLNSRDQQIEDLKDKLAAAEKKAAQAPVEVIKEVPVYTHDKETKDNVTLIVKMLKTIHGMIANLFKKR